MCMFISKNIINLLSTLSKMDISHNKCNVSFKLSYTRKCFIYMATKILWKQFWALKPSREVS